MPWQGFGELVEFLVGQRSLPVVPISSTCGLKLLSQHIGSCTSDVLEPIDDLVSSRHLLNSNTFHQN